VKKGALSTLGERGDLKLGKLGKKKGRLTDRREGNKKTRGGEGGGAPLAVG